LQVLHDDAHCVFPYHQQSEFELAPDVHLNQRRTISILIGIHNEFNDEGAEENNQSLEARASRG
jgi:hypothetical protein